MKIPFDTSGITSSCPVADAGIATSEECKDCEYLIEFDGFDIVCNYVRPIMPGEWVHVTASFTMSIEPEQEE